MNEHTYVNTMFEKDWYQRVLRERVGHWCMWALFSLVVGLGIGSMLHGPFNDVPRPSVQTEVTE